MKRKVFNASIFDYEKKISSLAMKRKYLDQSRSIVFSLYQSRVFFFFLKLFPRRSLTKQTNQHSVHVFLTLQEKSIDTYPFLSMELAQVKESLGGQRLILSVNYR